MASPARPPPLKYRRPTTTTIILLPPPTTNHDDDGQYYYDDSTPPPPPPTTTTTNEDDDDEASSPSLSSPADYTTIILRRRRHRTTMMTMKPHPLCMALLRHASTFMGCNVIISPSPLKQWGALMRTYSFILASTVDGRGWGETCPRRGKPPSVIRLELVASKVVLSAM